MIQSLRTKLLAGVVSGMILLLVIFSLMIYGLTRRALIKQFDASLLSAARMLTASVEQDGNSIELELEVQQMPEFQKTEHPTYYQIWRQDGTSLLKSPSLGMQELLCPNVSADKTVFKVLKNGNGRLCRGISFEFKPTIADDKNRNNQQSAEMLILTLLMARDTDRLGHNLENLSWLLLIASASTITLSVLIAAFIVRKGLVPLDLLACEIADIKENNLKTRIVTEPLPVEIMPIKNRLNDLLARLEASFKREQQFTANVAHELRTPLSGMRSTIEVALTRIREAEEYKTALSDCLAIAVSMQTMVDRLLMLARIDSNQITLHRDRIVLAEMINSCWRNFLQKAIHRNITFENHISAETSCDTDCESFYMVVSNLLENAVEYTNQGGQIWTEANHSDGRLEITFANTGCTLANDEITQVFDCYWRGDSSRKDTGIHCGLGLAVVQRIINALGCSAIAKLRDGGIFAIKIILPD